MQEYLSKLRLTLIIEPIYACGCLIYILKELKNPQLENEFIISVDNGTGLKETYPKTLITEKELERGLN